MTNVCIHGLEFPNCPWGCTIWPPTQVPDLDAAVDERNLIVRLRNARQELWDLVAAWEVRPELREAARQLTEVLESYDE